MSNKVLKSAKTLRKELIRDGCLHCFYCGLPFYDFTLPKGTPGSVKANSYSRISLEHLNPVSKGGETSNENCVLTHKWCNMTAANMDVVEKLALKDKLSNNNGIPPWWPVIEEIIERTELFIYEHSTA